MSYRSDGRRGGWQIGDRPDASVRMSRDTVLSAASAIRSHLESIARQIARIVDPTFPSRADNAPTSGRGADVNIPRDVNHGESDRVQGRPPPCVDFLTSRARRASGHPARRDGGSTHGPRLRGYAPSRAAKSRTNSRTKKPRRGPSDGFITYLSTFPSSSPLSSISRSELYLEPTARERSTSLEFEEVWKADAYLPCLRTSSYARQPISRTHISHDHRRLSGPSRRRSRA